jgi:hypothetical protein
MHLIERYALSCGVKIDKPFILEKFFPLSIDKYITFHPNSKYQSKCYSYWQDVLDVIRPVLKSAGIKIVQIGTKEDPNYKGCYGTHGQTSIAQSAYIISNALLHLGADSFATHVASGYGKKVVCLYSNNYANAVRPYWNTSADSILFEPERENGEKPNFSADEYPKTINTIKPEKIAAAVLQLLGLQGPSEVFKSVFFGGAYGNSSHIETVPNQVVDPKQFNTDSMIVRMDYKFDEDILLEMVKRFPCSIVTNKPINPSIITQCRPNVKEVIYDLTEESTVDFAAFLAVHNIPTMLCSALQGDRLNDIKLKFLDFGIINPKGIPNKEVIDKIKKDGGTHYRSCKTTLSDGKFYASKAAWLADKPFERGNFQEIIDNDDFWSELNYFRIVSTK